MSDSNNVTVHARYVDEDAPILDLGTYERSESQLNELYGDGIPEERSLESFTEKISEAWGEQFEGLSLRQDVMSALEEEKDRMFDEGKDELSGVYEEGLDKLREYNLVDDEQDFEPNRQTLWDNNKDDIKLSFKQ